MHEHPLKFTRVFPLVVPMQTGIKAFEWMQDERDFHSKTFKGVHRHEWFISTECGNCGKTVEGSKDRTIVLQ